MIQLFRKLSLLLWLFIGLSLGRSAFAQSTSFYYLPDELLAVDGDRYGEVLGAGDFNGDGKDDMVIAAPFKDLDGFISAGIVTVSYANASLPRQILQANDSGWPLEQGANFGFALASMELSGDTMDDLIIGVPGASIEGSKVGAIEIWFGSPNGLIFEARWVAEENPLQDGARFGAALAAYENKLFIGAPNAIVNGVAAGAVYFATRDSQPEICLKGRIDQSSPNVPGGSEEGDAWGASLSVRKDPDSNLARLAVGAPREDIGNTADAGAVWDLRVETVSSCSGEEARVLEGILYFQGDGLTPGSAEANDLFGSAVAFRPSNSPFSFDLVVGVPREDREIDGLGDTGCIHLLDGISPRSCLFADEISELDATSGQQTGFSLATADWNLDGSEDLLVGIPGNDDTFGREGAVALLNGSAAGLTPTQIFQLGDSGGSFWNYGTSVAFMDTEILGFTHLDILIGNPGWDHPFDEIDRAGRATRSTLNIEMIFGDGFESGDTTAWSP